MSRQIVPTDVENNGVQDFKPNHKVVDAAADVENVRDQLDKLCEAINKLKDKLGGNKADEEEDDKEETIWERICDNTLRDMFIGKDVTAEDIDNVVNTLTLMNALILTIPYGIMASTNFEYWDWVESTLAGCPDSEFTYDQDFSQFNNAFHTVVYSAITALLVAMVYYLLRPRKESKFKKWWKHARYVFIIMLGATVVSCVGLVATSAWLFSWYIIPTSKLCTFSAKYSLGAGVAAISICVVISMFLML